jgi:glycerate kinase
MNILIACDSFKDALGAFEVCQAIECGIKAADPTTTTTLFPLADGGEGTFDILNYHLHFKIIDCTVHDPLFRKINARYGLTEGEKPIAFIEMAQAAGLQLLTPDERNPRKTTTLGVGEMIADAIGKGAEHIVLGIGGSATNDAGMGMAEALGYQFLGENNEYLSPIGENLSKIMRILPPQLEGLKKTFPTIEVICDVKNPLDGEKGAAYVYARQKGATDSDIRELDAGLRHFAGVTAAFNAQISPSTEGGGAAGGLGYGAGVFLNAHLKRGIDLVLNLTDFENTLKHVDIVITGEGSLDSQTAHGKLIEGICRRTAKHHIPVVAFCGRVDIPPQLLDDIGLLSAFSINSKLMSLADALVSTRENLENTAYRVFKMLHFFKHKNNI